MTGNQNLMSYLWFTLKKHEETPWLSLKCVYLSVHHEFPQCRDPSYAPVCRDTVRVSPPPCHRVMCCFEMLRDLFILHKSKRMTGWVSVLRYVGYASCWHNVNASLHSKHNSSSSTYTVVFGGRGKFLEHAKKEHSKSQANTGNSLGSLKHLRHVLSLLF